MNWQEEESREYHLYKIKLKEKQKMCNQELNKFCHQLKNGLVATPKTVDEAQKNFQSVLERHVPRDQQGQVLIATQQLLNSISKFVLDINNTTCKECSCHE